MIKKSLIFVTLFVLLYVPNTYAQELEISLGLRLGGEMHISMAPVFNIDTASSTDDAINPFGLGGNFAMSLHADIRTRSWFAFTPGISLSISRFLTDKDAAVRATWHDLNFDILAKFFVGPWYFAAGPGFSVSTPASYTTRKNYLNSNIGDLGDNLKDLNMKPKASTRFTVTVDTGFYIPISITQASGYGKEKIGYVTIGLRTVVAPMVIDKLFAMSKARSEEVKMDYLDRLANKPSTFFSTGLLVGFSYIF